MRDIDAISVAEIHEHLARAGYTGHIDTLFAIIDAAEQASRERQLLSLSTPPSLVPENALAKLIAHVRKRHLKLGGLHEFDAGNPHHRWHVAIVPCALRVREPVRLGAIEVGGGVETTNSIRCSFYRGNERRGERLIGVARQ